MSIEISRRNFLKTAAASLILAGGVLTGCDSSKDNDTKNPPFVKHGKDDTFTFNDGTKVVFYGIKSRAESAEGKAPYHAITFTFTAPVNSATATLSPLNFSAYVTAPMTCTGLNRTAKYPADANPDSPTTDSFTIPANKSKHILARFDYVEGTPTFKITYNGQSIKFKENADSDKAEKPYLSTGIYTAIF